MEALVGTAANSPVVMDSVIVRRRSCAWLISDPSSLGVPTIAWRPAPPAVVAASSPAVPISLSVANSGSSVASSSPPSMASH